MKPPARSSESLTFARRARLVTDSGASMSPSGIEEKKSRSAYWVATFARIPMSMYACITASMPSSYQAGSVRLQSRTAVVPVLSISIAPSMAETYRLRGSSRAPAPP